MDIGKIFQNRLHKIKTIRKQLSCKSDMELLHKYRVNLRKLYAYNELYIKQIDKTVYLQVIKLLKQLLKPTARLRDVDIFLSEISLYDCKASCQDNLTHDLTVLRQDICKDFKKQVISGKGAKYLKKLQRLIDKKSVFTCKISKSKEQNTITNLSKELFAKLYSLDQKSPLHKIHKLRIRFKTLYYALLACKECKKISQLYITVKRLQDLFGGIQDCNVKLGLIDKLSNKLTIEQKKALKKNLNIKLEYNKARLLEYINTIKINSCLIV